MVISEDFVLECSRTRLNKGKEATRKKYFITKNGRFLFFKKQLLLFRGARFKDSGCLHSR